MGRAAPRESASARLGEGGGDPGILAASGLVAGEGLAGVLVAGLVAAAVAPRSMAPRIPGAVGQSLTLLALAMVCGFLAMAADRRKDARAAPAGQADSKKISGF